MKLHEFQLSDADAGSADKFLGSLIKSLAFLMEFSGKFVCAYAVHRLG